MAKEKIGQTRKAATNCRKQAWCSLDDLANMMKAKNGERIYVLNLVSESFAGEKRLKTMTRTVSTSCKPKKR